VSAYLAQSQPVVTSFFRDGAVFFRYVLVWPCVLVKTEQVCLRVIQ